MRLIDADALCEKLRESVNGSAVRFTFYCDVRDLLAKEPTVDPVKHGYLKFVRDPECYVRNTYVCSICGSVQEEEAKFCSQCGAALEQEEETPKGKWRLLNGKWNCSECGNKVDWPLKICDVCASEMEIEL